MGLLLGREEGVGMRIDVACGGTGGHVLPGVATARVLSGRGHDVRLWLTARDVEADAAASWDGPILLVSASGFASGAVWRWPGVALGLARAVLRCRAILRADPPDALLAMGSYACFGPALAAQWLRIPVVLHEGNAVPGRAVSVLAGRAAAVAVSFLAAEKRIRARKVVLTGSPIRDDLDRHFDSGTLRDDVPVVLVTGGSQGAEELNRIAVEALGALLARGWDLEVVHLAGRKNEDRVNEAYRHAGVNAHVYGFLGEVGKAYNAATIAVTRSGTATCAELCACGVPALLVPLPTARRNHQYENAVDLARHGGAEVIEERGLTPKDLADRLEACLRDGAKLERMSAAMKGAAAPDAAGRLADLVESVRAGE